MAHHELEPEIPASSFQQGNDFQPLIQDFSAPSQDLTSDSSIPERVDQDQIYQVPAESEQAYATEAYEPNQEPAIENASYDQETQVSGEVSSIEESPYDFSQPLDAVNEPEISGGISDSADFSDVTDFANSDTGLGPIVYTVTIDGIESSLLLSQLRDAMMDSRFGWDSAELLQQVGGGRLVLRSLSPAKASVLINRIKYLPFKISWRQDVLTGT